MNDPRFLPDDMQQLHDIVADYHFRELQAYAARRETRERLRLRAKGRACSLARTIACMGAGGLDGFEREYFSETARLRGEAFDPQRLTMSWSDFGCDFTRDLTAASAAGGGFLVGTTTQAARDVLAPWSVTARSGITIEAGKQGNDTIPKTTTPPAVTWLSTESTQAAPSTPVLAQLATTPKTAAAVVALSRQISLQAHADGYVRRTLLRAVGTAVDQAVLAGTGASGQPTGLLATAGVQTQSGAALSHAGVSNMKQLTADANAADEQLAFLGTNPVRELLETRARDATNGSGFVWDNDRVASRPAYTTTDMPAATLVCGAWPEIILALWGPGFEFTINPFDPAAFKTGVIQARVMVSCDVAVAHPAAFCVASSIT